MMHPIPGDERSRHEASESSFCSACPFCRGFFSRSWEFLSTCWLSLSLKNTHTNSYDIWKKHNGNNVRRNEVQQILWDIFELTFESVRNLGWISLVSPGIRASVYPHRQGTTCTPATPATHQASDVRWMTPWRYYRERNYKRKHIGITEDILISQQKLCSNFLWDTSLKLRYHTYGIAWRDDTYLLSNRMFHFQPGRHSTKTAARRPMRHFGRKMSKVYFFVHTRQDRGCEKPRRQHLSPSRPGIRLLASKKKTCKTLGPLGMYDVSDLSETLWPGLVVSKNYPHRIMQLWSCAKHFWGAFLEWWSYPQEWLVKRMAVENPPFKETPISNPISLPICEKVYSSLKAGS